MTEDTEDTSRQKDRLSPATTAAFDPHSLVGSYFHSDADASGGWQGCVVAEPSPGVYLVELFEWFLGGSSAQRLVRIEDMSAWAFYDDSTWLQNAYRNGKSYRESRREERAQEVGS